MRLKVAQLSSVWGLRCTKFSKAFCRRKSQASSITHTADLRALTPRVEAAAHERLKRATNEFYSNDFHPAVTAGFNVVGIKHSLAHLIAELCCVDWNQRSTAERCLHLLRSLRILDCAKFKASTFCIPDSGSRSASSISYPNTWIRSNFESWPRNFRFQTIL